MIDYCSLNRDLTFESGTGKVKMSGIPWKTGRVDLIDTGIKTQTGGRIKRLAPYMGKETFMLTWGDGVSNIDLQQAAGISSLARQVGDTHRGPADGSLRPPGNAGRSDCRVF